MSVDWRRLVALEDTMARRRRAGPLGHPAVRALAGGAALGGALVAGGAADGRAFWLLAALAAAALTVMSGPFRIFWRSDASLFGRLPIDGHALYVLALVRSLRLAGWLALALVVAALPGLVLEPAAWVRLVGLGVALVAAGGLAGPAVTVAAGALVVSAKTQELIRELASGQTAPGTVWLSLLPAAGAAGLIWAGWLGAAGHLELVAVAGAASLAAAAGGAALARATLAVATREVAALDAVKLAHVDKVAARGLERLWGAVAGDGRLVYDKDVALARRRHPGYYLLGGLALIALWITLAVAAPPVRERTAVVVVGALVAYAVLHGRRLAGPPIERPRLLDTLPLDPTVVDRAKLAHVAWRVIWVLATAALPSVVRAEHRLELALILGAEAVVALVAGGWLSRVPRVRRHPSS